MKLPKRVRICEVGTRDGFQIEPEWIPTGQKIEVVNRLSETLMPRIEVTSFVHPKAVPQLRDAEEVMAKITRRQGTVYAALVPNDKGAARALTPEQQELVCDIRRENPRASAELILDTLVLEPPQENLWVSQWTRERVRVRVRSQPPVEISDRRRDAPACRARGRSGP
jgi:hypothetical protein